MYVEVNYEKQAGSKKIWKPVIGKELVSFKIPSSMKLTKVRTTNFKGKDYTFFNIKEEDEDQTYTLFNTLREVFEMGGLKLEHTYQYESFMLRGIFHIESHVLNTISVHYVEGFEGKEVGGIPYVAKLSVPEMYY